MTDKIAITGDYCDLKFIKGRKVAQIVIEIPIEAATAFVAAFGAPSPAFGIPVAIARLDPGTLAAENEVRAMLKGEKQKRTWDQLSRAEQAGMKCEDPEFIKYLAATDSTHAAERVKLVCQVKSRANLDLPGPAALWDKLYSDFQMWKRGAAA